MAKRKEDGSVNFEHYIDAKGRRTVDMGENYDGSHTTLPAYVDVGDGIQVHPSRLKHFWASTMGRFLANKGKDNEQDK